jgi:hypothetical protein
MVKKVVLNIYLTSIGLLSFGQNYISDNATWHYTNPDGAGNPFVKCAIYEYNDDTIVEGKSCKVIESNYYDNIYLLCDTGNVYYYKYDRFNLLYAFDVNKGDTISLDVRCTGTYFKENQYVYFDSVFNIESLVHDIDSEYISGQYLKTVTVKFLTEREIFENSTIPSSFTYYEKFGYLVDGFIPIAIEAISIAIDMNRRLRCYADEEIDYISDWWLNYNLECDYIEPNDLNKINKDQIGVFPNPVNDYLQIYSDRSDFISFKLFDSLGLLISSGNKTYINFSQLKSGIYYLLITDSHNRMSFFKILKH